VWINEGFATYAEYLALEHLSSRKAAGDWMRETHSMATWAQDGSVFVPGESVNDMWRIFSMSLSYKKGAALVHHIRYMINDDTKFFGLLREFLTRYAYSSATAMDFKRIAEEKTGIDFTVFFDQWYYGEGFPVFNVSWEKKNGTTRVLIEHKGSAPSGPLFVLDMDILIHRANGTDTLIRVPVRSNRELFNIPDDISGMEIDPGYYVLKEVKNNTQVRDLPTGDNFVHCEPFIKRKQNLTVGFARATGRNCRLTLTDAPGRNIYAAMAVKQKKNVTIPMEDMPNGVYLLYVENGREQYVRKIVKTTY
jgi:aminopeptidase N